MPLTEFAETLTLIETNFEEISKSSVGRAAKRDSLSMKNTNNTKWWSVDLEGDQVGVVGLIRAKDKIYRLKSAFILPEWRRQGLYTITVVGRTLAADELGAEKVVSIVRPSSKAALLKLGWTQTNPDKPNHVELDLDGYFDEEDRKLSLYELTLRKLNG